MSSQSDSKLPFSLTEVKKINPSLINFRKAHRAALKELKSNSSSNSDSNSGSSSSNSPEIKEISINLRIGNDKEAVGAQDYRWVTYVRPMKATHEKYIKHVKFGLHPTFTPSEVTVEQAPFEIARQGWGTFDIKITIQDINNKIHNYVHTLTFEEGLTETTETITIKRKRRRSSGSSASRSRSNSGARRSRSRTPEAQEVKRMTGVTEQAMHGRLGVGRGWKAPIMITYCPEEARPGYNTMPAHEYREDPETFQAKVKLMAELIKKSNHCLTYTGAGISTASGIDDYASKSKASAATGSNAVGRVKRKTGLDAEPTFAHFTLTALHKAGYLKHWVQQNHDGLPQKAGFPQEAINEIHGAWFDPSNPVVPMSGSLRGDLMQWLLDEEHACDLVLTMGTSLCGMNADRMVTTCSEKAFLEQGDALGSVIIGFQQTQLDAVSSLRIYSNIDECMLLLAEELELPLSFDRYTPTVPSEAKCDEPHTFMVPYNPDGTKNEDGKLMRWDLSVGAKIKLIGGPGDGFHGQITRVPQGSRDSYSVRLPCTREGKNLGKGQHLYALGTWFVEAACNGTIALLPLVNI